MRDVWIHRREGHPMKRWKLWTKNFRAFRFRKTKVMKHETAK